MRPTLKLPSGNRCEHPKRKIELDRKMIQTQDVFTNVTIEASVEY